MGKLKTHKTLLKRFKITSRGKLVYRPKGWNHLRSKKDKKVRSRKKRERVLSKATHKKIVPLLAKQYKLKTIG